MSDDNDRRLSLWLRIIRAYTFNFPINRGKGRVFRFAKRFCRHFPKATVVPTRDGRQIRVGFRDWGDDHIFFLGTYEAFCTSVIRQFIREGSICFDVGANIGWYTTLFQSLCGPEGAVHSFEPVPSTFEELKRNVSLNVNASRVFLNDFGLGDQQEETEMFLFPDLPSGHASLANNSKIASTAVSVRLTTLNSYVKENQIDHVDLVKVDIEGAEIMFLKGATRLFDQKTPPVILMEMSRETCRAFDYSPEDLLEYISSRARYDFFVLNEKLEKLDPIRHFGAHPAGANVLCVPGVHGNQMSEA